jgi:hypothetical protein
MASLIAFGSLLLSPTVILHLVSSNHQLPLVGWNGLTLSLTYGILLVIELFAVEVIQDLKLRWMAKKAGATPIPRLRGRWLFNLDLMIE